MTPGQYRSGGKTRLGRITKRGDAYVRTLLIQGAKSVVKTAPDAPMASMAPAAAT